MRMIVNGVTFDNPDKIDVRFEVDGDESVGPCVVEVVGGKLTIRADGGAAITVVTKHGQLVLNDDRLFSSSIIVDHLTPIRNLVDEVTSGLPPSPPDRLCV